MYVKRKTLSQPSTPLSQSVIPKVLLSLEISSVFRIKQTDEAKKKKIFVGDFLFIYIFIS